MTKSTIDTQVHELLLKKLDLERIIFDAKDDLNNVESKLFDSLIESRSFEFLSINYKMLRRSAK